MKSETAGQSMNVLARAAAWTTMAAIPGTGAALTLAVWRAVRAASWSHWEVADALAVVAGVVGAAAAFNLTLCIALELTRVASVSARHRMRNLPTPLVARALVAAATGTLLVATAGAPALAADHGVGWGAAEPAASHVPSSAESSLEKVPTSSVVAWGTERVTDAPPSARTPSTGPPPAGPPQNVTAQDAAPIAAPRTVTVTRGDSLWRITAAALGGEASDATIASAWPELYAANQALIGANPHLIHPGQVLTIPEGFAS